jgi:hypothetical protein
MDENGNTEQPKLVTQIAVLAVKMTTMNDGIKRLESLIEKQSDKYISKEKHESDISEVKKDIQNQKEELRKEMQNGMNAANKRIGVLEKLIYGVVSMILTGFVGYILTLVFK